MKYEYYIVAGVPSFNATVAAVVSLVKPIETFEDIELAGKLALTTQPLFEGANFIVTYFTFLKQTETQHGND